MSPPSVMCAGPMAMPGDTPRPDNRRSATAACSAASETSSLLIEFAFDQLGESGYCRFGLAPGGGELDDRAWRSRQHHQPHDRATGNLGAVLADQLLGGRRSAAGRRR